MMFLPCINWRHCYVASLGMWQVLLEMQLCMKAHLLVPAVALPNDMAFVAGMAWAQ